MFDHYEWFKNEVYRLTQIDLNYYKEKQIKKGKGYKCRYKERIKNT